MNCPICEITKPKEKFIINGINTETNENVQFHLPKSIVLKIKEFSEQKQRKIMHKFRAIHKVSGNFIYWDQFGNIIGTNQQINTLDITLETIGLWSFRKCNEQELFEGDICEEFEDNTKFVLVTRFDKQTSQFGFDTYEYEIHDSNYCEFEPLDNYFVNKMKIIGNIHQTNRTS